MEFFYSKFIKDKSKYFLLKNKNNLLKSYIIQKEDLNSDLIKFLIITHLNQEEDCKFFLKQNKLLNKDEFHFLVDLYTFLSKRKFNIVNLIKENFDEEQNLGELLFEYYDILSLNLDYEKIYFYLDLLIDFYSITENFYQDYIKKNSFISKRKIDFEINVLLNKLEKLNKSNLNSIPFLLDFKKILIYLKKNYKKNRVILHDVNTSNFLNLKNGKIFLCDLDEFMIGEIEFDIADLITDFIFENISENEKKVFKKDILRYLNKKINFDLRKVLYYEIVIYFDNLISNTPSIEEKIIYHQKIIKCLSELEEFIMYYNSA